MVQLLEGRKTLRPIIGAITKHDALTVARRWRELGLSAFQISFLACVVAPTLLCFLYFLLWASPEYLSEARIAVRSNANVTMPTTETGENLSAPATTQSGAMFAPTALMAGGKSVSQDAFIVTEYIRSLSIIEDLGGKQQVRKFYSRDDVDWFSRMNASLPLEKVRNYWRGKVVATIDTISNIITVNVRAFSPQEAQELLDGVVKRSEALVNEMSDRSRRDALKRAEGEIEVARARLRETQKAMLAFRNETSVVDPQAAALTVGDMIVRLTREKMTLEANRATTAGQVTDESPTRRVLNAQIEAIENQIATLKERLTSQSSNNTISGQIASFEDLQLDAGFAQRMYSIAQSIYDKARVEQESQQLYVVTVVRPTLPEQVAYPRLFTDTLLIFVVCLILWSMVALVVASINEHVG
jgi:capsular polysaccharide transport system permease protein